MNQQRWEHLITLWNQAVEKLLHQTRNSNKKNRKKKAVVKNYSLIPAAIRNQVLHEYYRNCKLSFYRKLKIYLSNNRQMIRDGIISYIESKASIESLLSKKPEFLYVPTWVELLDLIEKAILYGTSSM